MKVTSLMLLIFSNKFKRQILGIIVGEKYMLLVWVGNGQSTVSPLFGNCVQKQWWLFFPMRHSMSLQSVPHRDIPKKTWQLIRVKSSFNTQLFAKKKRLCALWIRSIHSYIIELSIKRLFKCSACKHVGGFYIAIESC